MPPSELPGGDKVNAPHTEWALRIEQLLLRLPGVLA